MGCRAEKSEYCASVPLSEHSGKITRPLWAYVLIYVMGIKEDQPLEL